MNAAYRRLGLPIAGLALAQTFTTSSKTGDKLSSHAKHTTQAESATKQQQQQTSKPRPKLLFVGTGSSTGCPKPLCSMLFGTHAGSKQTTTAAAAKELSPEIQRLQAQYRDKCKTSRAASQGDPKDNKDYRNNPSLLISHCPDPQDGGEVKNIIIDAGKTFREGALRWFPKHDIATLDAIILTHHHMDAVGGLDDVRGFQSVDTWGTYHKAPRLVPMPLHLSQECLDDVSDRFPWLFPKQQPDYTSGTNIEAKRIERHVASLETHIFEPFEPMNVQGLEIIPLPVWHGDDLISYGFAFSLKGTNILYISDISRMVPKTLQYILKKLPPTDILIVDSLMPELPHSVHFSATQAIDLSKQIQAKQTYLVGMNCDAFATHDTVNEELRQKYGGKVLLAHDGQVIDL